MQKTLKILSLEKKLDYLIEKFDTQTDVFMQSHLSRYLIIITAGYFEQAIQNALVKFATDRAHQDIVNYVDSTLSWEGSINRDKLSRILKRFNQSWFEKLEASTTEAEKNAIDSVKELRDQLAHGLDNGTGYTVARNYHLQVRGYVERFHEIIP
jgi:RiboL-PSP-HEPN